MKSEELLKLKKLVEREISRKKRIDELLKDDLVNEYLIITNTEPRETGKVNMTEILNKVLSVCPVTSTNGIYVCTSAYSIDFDFKDFDYFTEEYKIDSEVADHRIYKDIESGEVIQGDTPEKRFLYRPLMSEFQKNNIVLNPYNTCKNNNGYSEVRMDYFKSALTYGEEKAKEFVLSKYKRL